MTPTALRSPSLFPAFVAQHAIAFDGMDPHDVEAMFPGFVLPGSLASAVPKRRLEFAAGRHCAREALRRCSPGDAGAVIGTGENREPLWPAGITGAITHADGYASAAVAKTTDARGLGLDAEVWLDHDKAAEGMIGPVAERAEVDAVARALGWSFPHALTLVFSAKETVFKCFFPEVNRYFDFKDAAILGADPVRGEFTGKLLVALTPRLVAGYVFRGRFEHDEARVYTAMTEVG